MIIGDVMLDEYKSGSSTRISPEAPVPVIDDIETRHVLGGAGNVAINARVFCDSVKLHAVIGADPEGAIVGELLQQRGVATELTACDTCITIKKTRVLSNNQQICRIDSGQINSLASEPTESYDAIIVSDYGKGSLDTDLIQNIIMTGTPVIVDPKGTDWDKYWGAYAITPNKKEFEDTWGPFNYDTALFAVQALNLKGILVTLGASGMHWIGADGESIYLPTEAQEVIDVTGAGDTVIATFASFLHLGHKKAMTLANRAAGNVVAKLGTAVPDRKAVKEKIIFTNGCFDILHTGHLHLLRNARSMGDKLVVGINSDESIRRIKREPVNNQHDRKMMLEALDFVDWVIIFNEDTPYDLISELKPDTIVKGGDYKFHEVVGHDIVDETIIVPLIEDKSTTNIIERIKNGTH